ncbi:hypothetical protein EV424DRAFT_284644 [Suillus variegatus]|nr:hypothetical protein EV424DRAFT_284644 [Suillus variegatus]
MSASQNAPPRAHRRVVRDVPIVRQPGLNVAGQSSANQLGCASEIPESMNAPELPPRIYPPPTFSHDNYTSIPPNFQGNIPLPRASRFTGMAPRAAGPDRVQRSFAPAGDVASRYRMVYTYLPLRGAEKSRQEFTDGVVFRDETMGVQKSTTRRYKLPPVRPPRESLVSDPEPTPLATTTPPSASSTVARATRATAGPLVNERDSKTVVKDAKNYVVVETLNKCAFHDSSSRTTVVGRALTDACSLIITEDSLRKLWVEENLSALYKTIITPMSTILNRFKQSAQDLVEILYSLQLSIWTDWTAQINHTKSTVAFLICDDSLNYIFGNSVKVCSTMLRVPLFGG